MLVCYKYKVFIKVLSWFTSCRFTIALLVMWFTSLCVERLEIFSQLEKFSLNYSCARVYKHTQGWIQDLIRGGAPDRDRPKIAILGPQFCRILVLGPHFWWSGGGPGPRGPPGSAPDTCTGL